jgi:hypothetical protein
MLRKVRSEPEHLCEFLKVRLLIMPLMIHVVRCIHKIALSCPAIFPFTWNNSTPTGQIFMVFNIWVFFKNLLRILKFIYIDDKNNRSYTGRYISICDYISLYFSSNDKCFRQKL